jgi:DNA mismatch endonuclease, patch repair protein
MRPLSVECLLTMDIYDERKRSEIMRAVKSKDSRAELTVRRMLHRAGFRYRLHASNLPGKPDIVFPIRKKVVFIHGCFWHQHKSCRAATRPASNTEYWQPKLKRNVERDIENQKALQELGWETLTILECQLRHPEVVYDLLLQFLEPH